MERGWGRPQSAAPRSQFYSPSVLAPFLSMCVRHKRTHARSHLISEIGHWKCLTVIYIYALTEVSFNLCSCIYWFQNEMTVGCLFQRVSR